MPLRGFSLSLLFVTALSPAFALFAQEKGEVEKISKAEEFLFGEEVVVSAAKHEEPLSRSPSAVTVISAEDIRSYGVQNLADAFRLVPGLDVQARSPSGNAVNIRQSSEGRNFPVLFLIDGRKMTNDLVGEAHIESLPVSLEDIERIEVIRGPGSALYGAALNGVINIITKDPEKTEGFLFRASGGNFHTREMIGRASGKRGDLRYRVIASTDATDSREASIQAKSSSRATTKLLYDISPLQTIEFQSGFDRTFAEMPTDLGPVGYDMFQPFAFLHYWRKKKDSDLHVQLHYSRMEAILSIPTLENTKDSLGSLVGGAFSYTDFLHIPVRGNVYDIEGFYTPFANIYHNRLTVGAQLRYIDARTPVTVQRVMEETVAALYLQDEFSPVETLTFLLGGRYDYNSISKPSFSPRVSIVYVPAPGHSIRASYGESFRRPSFLENQARVIGLTETPIGGKRLLLSNPDLKNQRNVTYEAGYQWRHPRIRAFLDAFYSLRYNLFFFNYETFLFNNDPKELFLRGGEIGAEWIAFPELLRVFAMYSLVEGNDIGGIEVPQSRTFHRLSGGAHLSLPWRTSFSVQAHAIDERPTTIIEPSFRGLVTSPRIVVLPSYVLLNASASYTFPRPKIEVGLTVFNVINADAYDYPRLRFTPPFEGEYGGERLSRTIMAFLKGEF